MSFLSRIKTLFTATSAPAQATQKGSRTIARERLSVILASQRGSDVLAGVDTEKLQREVMEIVKRHIHVAENRSPQFQVKQEGDVSLFEMQVELQSAEEKSSSR